MTVRIDISLSGRFSVVEQTIFQLVLCGVKDVNTITILLCVYSDDVLANAIKKLVNYQILRVSLESRTLSISEPVLAVIEKCLEQTLYLEDSAETQLKAYDNKLYITDEDTKQQILNALLPGINIGFLTKSIDFVVYERGVEDEQ